MHAETPAGSNESWLRRPLLQIHFCVLLWGLTAILGKLISLSAVALVWWRMLIVVTALALLPRFWRELRRLRPGMFAVYAGIGALVMLHWVTFYGSIKLSNASVAVSCLGLGPVFAALIEPALTGRRFDPRELLLGIAVLPGVALVVGGMPSGMHLGFAVGAFSTALLALFGVLNKRYIHEADPLVVTGVEIGTGTLLLTLLVVTIDADWALLPVPDARDAALLLMLALGCTLLPFALSLVALRRISAYSAQLALNLEPVYAIVLAIVLLGEQRELGPAFYLGVAIILGAAIAHPLLTASSQRVTSGDATTSPLRE
jgi:drug/metabolite transporter (DMT)-like permease